MTEEPATSPPEPPVDLPSATGEEAPDAKDEAPTKEVGAPREGMEWVTPRRIALIVAFGISLAFYFATAAGLLQVRQSLPVAAGLALVGGIAEVPPLVFFVGGLERRCIDSAPLLLLSAGCGMESYFVGGSVGVASSATLGGAVITMVLFFMVGHRLKESRRRRLTRVRRWARNAAIAGVIFLLVAFAFYTAYTESGPVEAIANASYTGGTVLFSGEQALNHEQVNGSAGDVLYLQLGASNSSVGVTGTILNSVGNAMANVTAGGLTTPNAVFLDLRVDPGTYSIRIVYPSAPGNPSSVEVSWGLGDIPAAVQAETGAFLSGAWGGFVLLVLGGTLFVMARPPPEEAALPLAAEGNVPLSGSSAAPPTAEGESAKPADAGSPTPEEGSSRTGGVVPEVSDEGRT